MDSSKNLFEEELVISKLMGEPRAIITNLYGYVPTEVVIFDGVPMTLRMFMILTINVGSGQTPETAANLKLSRELEDFWDEVGFVRPENSKKAISSHHISYVGSLMAKILTPPPEQKVEDLTSFGWVRELILSYINKNRDVDMRVVIDRLLDDLRAYHRDLYPPQQ